ncbi:MAG: helix-turn-helix domain-containing protein, partial [Chloroflexota bacterium]
MARRIDPKTGYPIDVLNPHCPSHHTLGLLADKWAMCVIITLNRKGRLRTSQLKRALGVSSKVLTQTLRKLERCGIIVRETYDEMPPRVEYDLTDLGIT